MGRTATDLTATGVEGAWLAFVLVFCQSYAKHRRSGSPRRGQERKIRGRADHYRDWPEIDCWCPRSACAL